MKLHIRQFPDLAPKLRLEHCLLVSHGHKPPAIAYLDNNCGKWEEGRRKASNSVEGMSCISGLLNLG
ncbi:hypothetical protein NEUTE2DRAFT_53778 [Neurospora tetrasperma FGSC 2509]|nr:hypothetical protein NEUTE2DRAFT_53778 [Neurospora tetrasperma FGSC 2509]